MLGDHPRQYTFRLPERLVARIDECLEQLRRSGLSVNRSDTVRMLIARGLETTHCNADELLGSSELQKA
jgi:hypothetical protein